MKWKEEKMMSCKLHFLLFIIWRDYITGPGWQHNSCMHSVNEPGQRRGKTVNTDTTLSINHSIKYYHNNGWHSQSFLKLCPKSMQMDDTHRPFGHFCIWPNGVAITEQFQSSFLSDTIQRYSFTRRKAALLHGEKRKALRGRRRVKRAQEDKFTNSLVSIPQEWKPWGNRPKTRL